MSSLRAFFFAAVIAAAPLSAITLNQFNVSYTEDFDTLLTGTGSVMPAGWEFIETGSGANTTYGAGTGSSSTGNTYSFGATSALDRALGSVRTSSVASTFGTVVTNQTGGTVTQLTISFTGEQWRLGALSRVDRLDFGYSLDGTSVGTGTWTDVDQLDFVGPVTTGVLGALDGNAPENQTFVTFTITGLNLQAGANLWLRWVDFDASGSDDGLAIDNFSIMAGGTTDPGQGVPDGLPNGVVVAVIGGLLVLAARYRGMSLV
jgi:hypothetical protein